MDLIEKLIDDIEEDADLDLEIMGNYPIVHPGITLLHGLTGTMKSYTSALMAGKSTFDKVVYLDFESNPIQFREFCEANNIIKVNPVDKSIRVLYKLTKELNKEGYFKTNKVLFKIDSYSYIFELPVNKTNEIDKTIKRLREDVVNKGYSVLLIDHARRGENGSVDIRGGDNKLKFVDVSLKVLKADIKKYTSRIVVEKSRALDIQVNSEFSITTKENLLLEEFKQLIRSKGCLKSKREFRMTLSVQQRAKYKEYLEDYKNYLTEVCKHG
jgi:hypothetical protein